MEPCFRYTFKDRLSSRYDDEALPGVDIFVCTADPRLEPPAMVISTVLSLMAYDYPPQKLSVYLSDDGGSSLTFYALLEASRFARLWLPFCRKLKVEPRSPEAYFQVTPEPVDDPAIANEWLTIKKSYEDMKSRIEIITRLGEVPTDIHKEHKGFDEWDLVSSRHDHQTIVQVLIDGRDPNAIDIEGKPLPTLVYLAREKRPQFHHHFKAGALNALIRVSSKISNAPFVLNVDCDMYSNNSNTIRDALCFLLDEENGHDIAYEGQLQIFLSKHCTLLNDRKNMPLKLQLSYCIYMLWAPSSIPTLYFVLVPSFCLLKDISLFPKISSIWGVPYLYVFFVHRVHSLVEFVWCGGTVRGWLNEQRMWMFKRTTSYFFAVLDYILKLCQISESTFVITRKVADDNVNRRYEKDIMDFGISSPMFTVLATLALFNVLCIIAVGTKKIVIDNDDVMKVFDIYGFQIVVCCLLVFINLPVYQAMLFRKDSGKIPASVTLVAFTLAFFASALAIY
ncbi:Cellulose synthase-like protein E1 [Hibiscus syriacus]|uniref:Cellulose synthase-like protein E1 n=1 Tax=Hibiscus syriacus TaxID=106335 RepID=A0A6A3AV87_HIBSY|nr:Cellulose synthase-like protein E1 [Hibiscus syriacus]